MEYVKLGHSDLSVSRICLGCMGFGAPTIGQHSWTIGEEPTREIIRRSLELGVNFFDTAIAYQLGTSEQFVGRALRDMARRGDVVVATKFLPRTDEEIQQGINGRQHVLNNIDSSSSKASTDGNMCSITSTAAYSTLAWIMSICTSTISGTTRLLPRKSWRE